MKELRVALVGPYPPPFGGIASHLTTLIPGLMARGAADVAVVAFGATDSIQNEHGATIYRVNAKTRARDTVRSHPVRTALHAARLAAWRLSPRRWLAEAVRAQIVDEIVTQHRSNVVAFYQSNDAIELMALRRLWGDARGVILTVFGEVYDDPEFLSSRRRALGALLSSADALLSSSNHCAKSYARLGLPHRIEVLYYGVELERFSGISRQQGKKRYSFSDADVVALFMGRFTEDMGLGAVIETAPTLLERHGALRFVLAGAKGPLADAAARLASAHPGRVLVIHDVPFAEQPYLYAASDIVLTPTRDQHACMGMSIKEAMAAGRAVVGSDAGGIPEAIREGETGYLVPLDSDGAVSKAKFVEAISRLVSDAPRRDAFGRVGRALAERIFSHERTVDRVHEVLRSVAR